MNGKTVCLAEDHQWEGLQASTVLSEIQLWWARLALGGAVAGDVHKTEHPNKMDCAEEAVWTHFIIISPLFLRAKDESDY